MAQQTFDTTDNLPTVRTKLNSNAAEVQSTIDAFDAVSANIDSLINIAEPTNILFFGAVGDGVTDDTAAIQAGLDACETAGGGMLVFNPGTYMISASLDIPSNTALVGAGKMVTIIKAIPGTVFPAVKFIDNIDFDILRAHRYMLAPITRGDNGLTSNIAIRNLTVDWSSLPADDGLGQDASPCPIWIDSAEDVFVDDVSVINAYPAGAGSDTTNPTYRGTNFSVTQSNRVTVRGLDTGSAHYRSVEVLAGAKNVTFIGCRFRASQAWRHVVECASYDDVEPLNYWDVRDLGPIKFLGCEFSVYGNHSNGSLLSLHGGNQVTIEGCTFKVETLPFSSIVGVKVFGGASDVIVANNLFDFRGTFDGTTYTGIGGDSRSASFIHTQDSSNPTNSIYRLQVFGNTGLMKLLSPTPTWSPIIDNRVNTREFGTYVRNNVFDVDFLEDSVPLAKFRAVGGAFSNNTIRYRGQASSINWLRLEAFAGSAFPSGQFTISDNVVVNEDGGFLNTDGIDQVSGVTEYQYDNNLVISSTGRVLVRNGVPLSGYSTGYQDPTMFLANVSSGNGGVSLIRTNGARMISDYTTIDSLTGWFTRQTTTSAGQESDWIWRVPGNNLMRLDGNGTGMGDLELVKAGTGLILKSPGGTRYRLTVDNSGNLVIAAV